MGLLITIGNSITAEIPIIMEIPITAEIPIIMDIPITVEIPIIMDIHIIMSILKATTISKNILATIREAYLSKVSNLIEWGQDEVTQLVDIAIIKKLLGNSKTQYLC